MTLLLNYERSSIVVSLSGQIHARSIDELPVTQTILEATLSNVILDMRNVTFVKPAGACHIVCLAAWLSSQASTKRPLRLLLPKDDVASYLATLGFFTVLRH